MKIIIVDDEIHALHTFLNEIIEKNDLEYKFFNDNEINILNYTKENEIDAAFLDIQMPNINGIVLAEKLIEISPNIKIVFVTGQCMTTKEDLPDVIKDKTLGFLYKPYSLIELEKYLEIINKNTQQQSLEVKMFGTFECFIYNQIVRFTSNKSKELFALLLTYHGKSLSMTDAISQLWPDKDIEKSKILYRDAVWRLRRTLKEISFNCITFNKALLILNPKDIVCDYWDYLKNKNNEYNGEFLKSYDWSITYQDNLDEIREQRKKSIK